MKTSNKILLAILFTLIISNIVYALAMRKEYLTGNYKKPDFNYKVLPYRDFNEIIINPSDNANVKLVQGPFKVMVYNLRHEYLVIKQYGGKLQIDLDWGYARFNTGDKYMIIISCPDLKAVHANAFYTLNNEHYIDTVATDGWVSHHVLIDGFKQDSLTIEQQWGSKVELANNTLNYLKTVTSIGDRSLSKLTVLKTNIIQHANFDIRNRGQLILSEANIADLHYQLADSALLVINGAADKTMKR
ncbi:hypothetical protein SAMN05192574_102428 [Mucilaginibacter gossypiicola]|uniref:Uncharacterized protein n=1 Tax=Mucilaginibacter gossypiicola TaxID=551995 RepID=A0A1H8DRQ6_9SPHI|nr:hypothetical protein [Mucilaginibacter gossypiicola]SEN09227.1 hypothetical protein SAMN05192574_102428 [Mucilaginibacter gossypiicola]